VVVWTWCLGLRVFLVSQKWWNFDGKNIIFPIQSQLLVALLRYFSQLNSNSVQLPWNYTPNQKHPSWHNQRLRTIWHGVNSMWFSFLKILIFKEVMIFFFAGKKPHFPIHFHNFHDLIRYFLVFNNNSIKLLLKCTSNQ
jgi:hypothetical protein